MQILGAYVVFVVGMVAVALMAILCAAIAFAGYEGAVWLRATNSSGRRTNFLSRP